MYILKRNNVQIIGEGEQTLIFAHGYGGNQTVWRLMTDAFKKDFKIILFDYVGCGHSDHSAFNAERYKTLRGFSQDLLDICEALHITNAVYVGHSVSSMIGVLAAIEHPEYFSKLILLGPSACYLTDGDYAGGIRPHELEALFEVMDNNYQGWARSMAPAVMGNPDRPELGERFADDWADYDPAIAKNFVRATFLSDNRAYLPKLKVPSLSIICDDDILASPYAIQYILDHTPGNSLIHINATGHCPHLSAPDEVTVAIKNYLLN